MTVIYVLMTLTVFFLLRYIFKSLSHPFANPLLWSIVFFIGLFSLTTLDLQAYSTANANLVWLLEPAVVAFAIPLFNQLQQLKQHLTSILLCCLSSVFIAMLSGTLIARLMTTDKTLLLSILPKSVTTPIAMEISQPLGGLAPLTAGIVIIVGLFGAIVGVSLLKLFKITDPQAQGLAMGCAAHTVGTATIIKEGETQGAFSSIALVLCGIFTAILAPLFAWFINHVLS